MVSPAVIRITASFNETAGMADSLEDIVHCSGRTSRSPAYLFSNDEDHNNH
jgi:hypothetical protein